MNAWVVLRFYVTAECIDGLLITGVNIWEPAFVTSATLTFFGPVRTGSQEYVDGNIRRNNPAESVLVEANVIWPDAGLRI